MNILKFENDINGTEERTYIISRKTSRKQMAKILNRALNSIAWYESNTATDNWAYFDEPDKINTIIKICEKYDWEITTTIEQPVINWRSDKATKRQIEYLYILNVDLKPFDNLTKGLASDLIEAAKNDELGTVHGAFYMDGSN